MRSTLWAIWRLTPDPISKVRQLTDSSQVVTDDYSFDAWGTLVSSTGSTANSQLWKGQYLVYRKDPDAGPEVQYAMHHRNYNPKTGVFTSADPAKDDLNLYRYVKNNPVNRTDPTGLEEKKRLSRSAELYEAFEAGNGPSYQSGASFDEQRRTKAQIKSNADSVAAPVENVVAAGIEAGLEASGANTPKKILAHREEIQAAADTLAEKFGTLLSEETVHKIAEQIAQLRKLGGGSGIPLIQATPPEVTESEVQAEEEKLKRIIAAIAKANSTVAESGLNMVETADNFVDPAADGRTYGEHVGDIFQGYKTAGRSALQGAARTADEFIQDPGRMNREALEGILEVSEDPIGNLLEKPQDLLVQITEFLAEKSSTGEGRGELVGAVLILIATEIITDRSLGALLRVLENLDDLTLPVFQNRRGAIGFSGIPDEPPKRIRTTRRYSSLSDSDLMSRIRRTPKNDIAGSKANQLRYERYRRSGGQLTPDDWFPLSRGSRSDGPNHQAIQNRLAEDVSGARKELTIEDRVADVYWPKNPETGAPTIHQIGEINAGRLDPIARERLAIQDLVDELTADGKSDYEIWFWDKTKPDATAPALKIKVSDFPPPDRIFP